MEPKFDPSKPFTVEAESVPAFDPTKPFDVEASDGPPAFDPSKPFKEEPTGTTVGGLIDKATAPFVAIPKVDSKTNIDPLTGKPFSRFEPGLMRDISIGAENLGRGVAEGFESPFGIATAGAGLVSSAVAKTLPTVSRALARATGAALGAAGIKGAAEAPGQVKEAIASGDRAGAITAAAAGVLSLPMIYTGAKTLVGSKQKPSIPASQEVPPPTKPMHGMDMDSFRAWQAAKAAEASAKRIPELNPPPQDAQPNSGAGGFQAPNPMDEIAASSAATRQSEAIQKQIEAFRQFQAAKAAQTAGKNIPELSAPVQPANIPDYAAEMSRVSPDEMYAGREVSGPPRGPEEIVLSRAIPVSPEGVVVGRKPQPQRTIEGPTTPIVEYNRQPLLKRSAQSGAALPNIAAPLAEPTAGLAKGTGSIIANATRWYSEPIIESLARISGGIHDAVLAIPSRTKKFLGELAVKGGLDDAMKAAGRGDRASLWLSDIQADTASGMGVSNIKVMLEGDAAIGGRHVDIPDFVKPTQALYDSANRSIGKLAEKSADGFVATGKMQQNITALGVDIILDGKGEPLRRWAKFIADKNPKSAELLLRELQSKGKLPAGATPFDAVMQRFADMKAAFEAPGADASKTRAINQDFSRRFTVTPTHIKMYGAWHELVHSDAVGYLKNAAARTASAAAFREVFPAKSGELGRVRQQWTQYSNGMPAEHFDIAARALQGMPQPLPYTGIIRPTNPAGMVARALVKPIYDVMTRAVLSGNFFVNIPETLVGGSAQFLGMKAHLQGLFKSRELYSAMEQAGNVNKFFYDFSFNPHSPLRSIGKIASNAITKVTASQVLNEVQEATAGAAARTVSTAIREGTLSKWQLNRLPHTLEIMGFSKEQAGKIMAGDEGMLAQFESKAAPFLSAGNMLAAEGSRAFNSRIFNTAFKFQSYPMMKLNQIRASFGHLTDVLNRPHTGAEVYYASEMAARNIIGTTAQGAMTALITSVAFGGLEGLKQKILEAEDNPVGFLADAGLAAVGGPLYIVARGMQQAGRTDWANQFLASMFPYSITKELWEATSGGGAYSDMKPADRLDKFMFERIPGGRIIRQVLSVAGLSQRNEALDADIRSFRRWKGQTLGWRQEQMGRWEDENKSFRAGMKAAFIAAQRGQSVIPGIKLAVSDPNKPVTYSQLAASLRARTILRDLDGGALSSEQVKALVSRIGQEAYRRLQYHDAKLNVLAEALGKGGDRPAVDKTGIEQRTQIAENKSANPVALNRAVKKTGANLVKKENEFSKNLRFVSPMSPLNAPIYQLPISKN